MSGWLVFLIILILIVAILLMPIVISFNLMPKKNKFKVTFFCIPVFSSEKKKKEKRKKIKQKKSESKKEKNKKNSDNNKKEKQPLSLSERWELIRNLLSSVKKGLRWMLKGVRITNLFLDWTISKFDAYECAIAYGRANIALYQSIAFSEQFFTIKKEHIALHCGFGKEESDYNIRFKLKICPASMIISIFVIGISFLIKTIKSKIKEN